MNNAPPNLPLIRSAVLEDAASLAALSRQLLEAERSLNVFAGELNPWAASVAELRKQLQRMGTRFFVAECDGQVVGYVKAMIYGQPLVRNQVGTLRWLEDRVERAARRLYNFVLRRPRSNIQATGGYIAGTFVHPDFRRTGVGRLLIAAVEDWFRRQGLSSSELHVFHSNEGARLFWEEAGYEPLAMTMRKKL